MHTMFGIMYRVVCFIELGSFYIAPTLQCTQHQFGLIEEEWKAILAIMASGFIILAS